MKGVSDTLFAVQSGEWGGLPIDETREVVKVDDYMTQAEESLESICKWSWGYGEESIESIKEATLTYENGVVTIFVSKEQMRGVNDVAFCYVNCSSHSISSGIYTEESVNVSKLIKEEGGVYFFENEWVKKILSNGDPYRVRMRFGGFSGEIEYSKPLFVCEGIMSKQESLRSFTILDES